MITEPAIAESLPMAQQFLATTIESSQFELVETSISAQEEWKFRDGALSHTSGGFFHVSGLTNRETGEERLVLFQPQSALTGLALCRVDGIVHVLLQARIEPGISGIGQYGPTIQSTPANYLRLHGGKQTPYLELFITYSSGARPLANSTQLDLGERYFQKSKIHAYVEVPELIETVESTIWVPLPVIAEASGRDNFLNADLRSLLSVFDWDLYLHGQNPPLLPLREDDFYSAWISGNRLGAGSWQLAPVTELCNWNPSDEGVVDVSGSGISVGMYRTSCATREVRTWTQPLMRSSSRGKVALLMRSSGDDVEFLISLRSEFGIAAGQAVLPSCVIYPGERRKNAIQEPPGVIVARFVQSDEGGRFYKHENVYELVRLTGKFETEPHQYWVSSRTLKQLLKTSDAVGFQLRCIASLFLETLNPASFFA
jgi:oxidase EvaA